MVQQFGRHYEICSLPVQVYNLMHLCLELIQTLDCLCLVFQLQFLNSLVRSGYFTGVYFTCFDERRVKTAWKLLTFEKCRGFCSGPVPTSDLLWTSDVSKQKVYIISIYLHWNKSITSFLWHSTFPLSHSALTDMTDIIRNLETQTWKVDSRN